MNVITKTKWVTQMCYLFIFACLCLRAHCVCVVMRSENVVFTALIVLFLHRGFTRSSILALVRLTYLRVWAALV
jgi:ABC-type transport system involved in cytochrome c biogenesis permease subunit